MACVCRYKGRGPQGVRFPMRRAAYLIASFIIAITSTARAADDKAIEPSLLVRLKPLDGLIADVKYIAQLVGQGNGAEQLDGLIDAWVGDKGLAGSGIDRTKPVVLYAIATPGGTDSPFAFMI